MSPYIIKSRSEYRTDPDPKSDLKNYLTYIKNQFGQHIAKEMADSLTVSRATFFRKIKGLVIDQESKENKECEFCLRLGNVPPSPSVPR